jgi:Homing endonuclease associated repeat
VDPGIAAIVKSQQVSPQRKLQKEEVLQAIRDTARKLGHTPHLAELARMGVLERMHVRRHFRSYTLAVRECGLEPQVNVQMLPMETLFEEWATKARKLRRLPVLGDFPAAGKLSRNMFIYRFGGWLKVPEAMARYAKAQRLTEKWQDVMKMIAKRRDEGLVLRATNKPARLKSRPAQEASPIYGRALAKGPLVNEPINEAGVLFLFGALAERLGFRITLVQTGFPDIEALVEVSPGRWKRVRIEVEYESRNFITHGHRVDGCELIVCWIHNWKGCPLEVIELSRVMEEIG